MTETFSRICVDADILIYAMEKADEPGVLARQWLTHAERGRFVAVTSELSLAGVLSQPIRHGNQRLIDGYERLLTGSPSLTALPVDRPVLLKAAFIRARFGARLPDAIHAASAELSGCEAVLTEDQRLKVTGGMRTFRLTDVTAY